MEGTEKRNNSIGKEVTAQPGTGGMGRGKKGGANNNVTFYNASLQQMCKSVVHAQSLFVFTHKNIFVPK